MTDVTYAPVGATRTGDLPPHFNHLRYRTAIGTGAAVYRRAGEQVVTFGMHRAAGIRIRTGAARAEPGVLLTVVAGPMRAPCEVIWAESGEQRTGFGYGTRAGHPESGEEAFLVERDEQDRVWFSVVAYSRPANLLTRLAGPLAVLGQHLYARVCGRALRRLCTVKP